MKLSYDEAKTWPIGKTLEPGPSGYCDLAVLPDGSMLCLYESASEDNKDIFKTSRLTLAHFNLEWLSDGKDAEGR